MEFASIVLSSELMFGSLRDFHTNSIDKCHPQQLSSDYRQEFIHREKNENVIPLAKMFFFIGLRIFTISVSLSPIQDIKKIWPINVSSVKVYIKKSSLSPVIIIKPAIVQMEIEMLT